VGCCESGFETSISIQFEAPRECLSTYKAAFQELSDAVWLRENYVTVQAKYSSTSGHVGAQQLVIHRGTQGRFCLLFTLSLSAGGVIDRVNSAVWREAFACVSQFHC